LSGKRENLGKRVKTLYKEKRNRPKCIQAEGMVFRQIAWMRRRDRGEANGKTKEKKGLNGKSS